MPQPSCSPRNVKALHRVEALLQPVLSTSRSILGATDALKTVMNLLIMTVPLILAMASQHSTRTSPAGTPPRSRT